MMEDEVVDVFVRDPNMSSFSKVLCFGVSNAGITIVVPVPRRSEKPERQQLEFIPWSNVSSVQYSISA